MAVLTTLAGLDEQFLEICVCWYNKLFLCTSGKLWRMDALAVKELVRDISDYCSQNEYITATIFFTDATCLHYM